ncbi:MAG: hypothetical protein AAF617_15520 [Bacteroidota bacterium]
MRTFKKHAKCLSIVCIILVFFQSCQVYRSKSSTIEEAVKSNGRVKIHTLSGEKIKYKKILKKEGMYYGIVQKDTLQIDTSKIARLRLKNKTLSTIYTVLVSTVSGLTVLTIIALQNLTLTIG